jgi:flagellar biosynthesis protein FliP
MRQNSTSGLGALHPILFFLFIYGLSLFLALFVCRTVFYSINGESNTDQTEETITNDDNRVAAANLTASVFK